MPDEQAVYALPDKYRIICEEYGHPAVCAIGEMDAPDLPHKEPVVKNLFLCGDKKTFIW